MIIYYGTDTKKINITDIVLQKCLNFNIVKIPKFDINRSKLFTDPVINELKNIYI